MFDHTLSAIDLLHHWNIWLVTVTLVVAAVIDGKQLKVPNWLTLPMILSGWVFNFAVGGWAGLGWSLVGTVVGLALLLPAYAIGGMGAGDVKLLAGVGAWVQAETTFYAFCWSAVIGGVIAVLMILARRGWQASGSILDDLFRNHDDRQSDGAIRDRRRTKELDAAAAVRDSNRDRNDRLLCVERDALKEA